jgi:hypothetical protein
MKSIIISLMLIMAISHTSFCQIPIPKEEVSIYKNDTLVWIAPYKSLLLCHFKGKRERLLWIHTKYTFEIDTIQFIIKEDAKNSEELNKPRLILNSEYCSFIDLDPHNCYFYIFKRYKKNIFVKAYWDELATMILPPIRSGLSGRLNNPDVDITDKVFLKNVFTSFSTYTNGKSETHSYSEKLNTFTIKSN